MTKDAILQTLESFVRKPPMWRHRDFEYTDDDKYQSQLSRSALKTATALIDKIARCREITADHILAAARAVYGGRLSIVEKTGGTAFVSYDPGLSSGHDYRSAVCAVLQQALANRGRTP